MVSTTTATHIRLLGRGGHGAQSRGMMGRGVRGGGGGGGRDEGQKAWAGEGAGSRENRRRSWRRRWGRRRARARSWIMRSRGDVGLRRKKREKRGGGEREGEGQG